MTKTEIQELLRETHQLLDTLRAEVTLRTPGTGPNLNQARWIWLYSLQKELQQTGEYWNIHNIPDTLNDLLDQTNGK